jgi:hypothetical protein
MWRRGWAGSDGELGGFAVGGKPRPFQRTFLRMKLSMNGGLWSTKIKFDGEVGHPLLLEKIIRTRKSRVILIVLLVTLGGCTDTADMFPLNAAARQLGPVKASFVRTGIGRGPVTVAMADSEILTGEYRVAFGSSVGMAFSGTRSGSAVLISDGPVQFVMTGPKTQMLCRGTSSTMGHGNGECQTYDGAIWAISW